MRKPVTVTFDAETHALTLGPSAPIELGQGDWVEWNFSNAPSGSLPIIEFDSPFGPFQCLQSVPNGIVQGKGNVGEDGEGTLYDYKAFLLDQSGALATSGTSSVRNLPQPPNTSPSLKVRVTEGEEAGTLHLHIPPEPLMLFPGDTAFWNVFGLPPGTFISFLFHPVPEQAALDPLVGPFQSLVARRRVEGEEANVMRVTGVDFTSAPTQGEYSYQIAVRDSAGTVLASQDPTIDNLGQPPG